jgi:hypothetical protein
MRTGTPNLLYPWLASALGLRWKISRSWYDLPSLTQAIQYRRRLSVAATEPGHAQLAWQAHLPSLDRPPKSTKLSVHVAQSSF